MEVSGEGIRTNLGEGQERENGGQNGVRASKQPRTLSIYVLRREFHTLDREEPREVRK